MREREREKKREERGREEVGGNQFGKQSTNLITYTQCKSHDHLTTPTKQVPCDRLQNGELKLSTVYKCL